MVFLHGARHFLSAGFSFILLWMQVSRFDMIGGIDVKWWGAASDDVDSFLSGKVISDAKLSGSYSNASLQVKFSYN